MHFTSKKTVLLKGGYVSMKKQTFDLQEERMEPIMKTNMIVGKIMKPVQSMKSDIIGGDIMDFTKAVKRNVQRIQQKRGEDENIKFIY